MIQEFIKQLEKKEDLDFLSMQSAIELIMTGEVDDLSIEAFLLALNAKGIKEKEIAAAARVMKEKSLKFSLAMEITLILVVRVAQAFIPLTVLQQLHL